MLKMSGCVFFDCHCISINRSINRFFNKFLIYFKKIEKVKKSKFKFIYIFNTKDLLKNVNKIFETKKNYFIY